MGEWNLSLDEKMWPLEKEEVTEEKYNIAKTHAAPGAPAPAQPQDVEGHFPVTPRDTAKLTEESRCRFQKNMFICCRNLGLC